MEAVKGNNRLIVIFYCCLLLGVLIFCFIQRDRLSYFISETILNPLGLDAIEGVGIFLLIFFLHFILLLFLVIRREYAYGKRTILILLIAIAGCIYSFCSPFSDKLQMSKLMEEDVIWYYRDFKSIGHVVRSNVGLIIPPNQFEEVENYIKFHSDSVIVTKEIKTARYTFQFVVHCPYVIDNRKIIFKRKDIQLNVFQKFTGIDSQLMILTKNLESLRDQDILNTIPIVEDDSKEKVLNSIRNASLFKYSGKISLFVVDFNSRGGGMAFDAFLYADNKSILYSKFHSKGYFDQF